MVGQPGDSGIPLGHDRDHPAAPRLHLFHVRHDLLVHGVLGGDEHHRHEVVDQRDRPMLHLGGGIALGVDVGDFLQFQGALERHGKVVAAPQVEDVLRAHHPLGDVLHLGRLREHALHQLRQATERPHHLASLEDREGSQPAHLEGEDREGRDLTGERLGRGDPDLGPGVQIDAAVDLARDGRAHHVHEPQGARAAAFRLAQRRQRVRRLARL